MDNGRKGGKSFSHSEIRYTCWKFKGGKNRDRKGEITGVENDVAAWAISHSESRPDTSASIIQITMANEQDPNKITLELTKYNETFLCAKCGTIMPFWVWVLLATEEKLAIGYNIYFS